MTHIIPTCGLRMGLGLVVTFVAIIATTAGQTLPGLTFNGNRFTYAAPDGVVTGVLLKPSGSGPFGGVLLSHGKGGTANNFMNNHGQEFVKWGLVCISVDYTHAGPTANSGQQNEGYSPENSRRARRALEILKAVPSVDPERIAAFGHSMGGFMTLGLSGELGTAFRAACAVAGGTSGTNNSEFAAPSLAEISGITAPMLLIHGSEDLVVLPAASEAVAQQLASRGVPHLRWVFQGAGHTLERATEKGPQIHAFFKAWLTQHRVLISTSRSAPVLDGFPPKLQFASLPASFEVSVSTGGGPVPELIAVSSDEERLPRSEIQITGSGATRQVTLKSARSHGPVQVALVAVGDALSFMRVVEIEIGSAGSGGSVASTPLVARDGKFINMSVRARAGSGENVLISGFVVNGTGARVLVRGVGPSLAPLGVASPLPDPQVSVYDSAGRLIGRNLDWDPALNEKFRQIGVFAFTNSRDAALELDLPAGAYTVHVGAEDGSEGVALAEVYQVP